MSILSQLEPHLAVTVSDQATVVAVEPHGVQVRVPQPGSPGTRIIPAVTLRPLAVGDRVSLETIVYQGPEGLESEVLVSKLWPKETP
jgi:hypothetical protein